MGSPAKLYNPPWKLFQLLQGTDNTGSQVVGCLPVPLLSSLPVSPRLQDDPFPHHFSQAIDWQKIPLQIFLSPTLHALICPRAGNPTCPKDRSFCSQSCGQHEISRESNGRHMARAGLGPCLTVLKAIAVLPPSFLTWSLTLPVLQARTTQRCPPFLPLTLAHGCHPTPACSSQNLLLPFPPPFPHTRTQWIG